MANLTSADIDAIIDKAVCCSGNLAYKAAKQFSFGLKCASETLRIVKLLNMYIEILSEYEVITSSNTAATGTVAVTGTNGTIQITVGGQPISNAVAFNTSTVTTASDVVASINSYTAGMINYTATHTLGTSRLTVSAPSSVGALVNGRAIRANVTGDMGISGAAATLVMAGGTTTVADGDSVITEEQALEIINNIGKFCDVCTAPAGSTYA